MRKDKIVKAHLEGIGKWMFDNGYESPKSRSAFDNWKRRNAVLGEMDFRSEDKFAERPRQTLWLARKQVDRESYFMEHFIIKQMMLRNFCYKNPQHTIWLEGAELEAFTMARAASGPFVLPLIQSDRQELRPEMGVYEGEGESSVGCACKATWFFYLTLPLVAGIEVASVAEGMDKVDCYKPCEGEASADGGRGKCTKCGQKAACCRKNFHKDAALCRTIRRLESLPQAQDAHACLPIPAFDLATFFDYTPNLRGSSLQLILAQVFLGVRGLHKSGVVHRDLKPDNILIDGTLPVTSAPKIAIADFGSAVPFVPPKSKIPGRWPTISGGTKGYEAPELLNGEGTFSNSDWYSIGILCIEAATSQESVQAHSQKYEGNKTLLDAATALAQLKTIQPALASMLEDHRILQAQPADRFTTFNAEDFEGASDKGLNHALWRHPFWKDMPFTFADLLSSGKDEFAGL